MSNKKKNRNNMKEYEQFVKIFSYKEWNGQFI